MSEQKMLLDSFKRKIDYLRLSVTDRCNLRCVYCLPEFYNRFTPLKEMMTDEETLCLVSIFVELGVSKIRITGGEPLLRPGLCELIRKLSDMNGISDVSLSTNGLLLNRMSMQLVQAGLKRVNISLDSLSPEKFRRITRRGELQTVLDGICSAFRAGLSPVKVNVVVVRGMNNDEIPAFVKLTESRPIHVRFIELMPMGETGFFSKEKWVPFEEIFEKASPLEPVCWQERPLGHGPANYYKRAGACGTVGFINALSCRFCASCNRIRLSSKGILFPCLDGSDGTDLLTPLRKGVARSELKQLILEAIQNKPERHSMLEKVSTFSVNPKLMCSVGG